MGVRVHPLARGLILAADRREHGAVSGGRPDDSGMMVKKRLCSREVFSWIVEGLTRIGSWRDFIKDKTELEKLDENLKSRFKWAGTTTQTSGLNTVLSTPMNSLRPSVH